jgi:hypothetical protein
MQHKQTSTTITVAFYDNGKKLDLCNDLDTFTFTKWSSVKYTSNGQHIFSLKKKRNINSMRFNERQQYNTLRTKLAAIKSTPCSAPNYMAPAHIEI